ncbi:MAG: aldehyde dehydrogenase family protein [Phycisphaerales bacterium]
MLIAGGWRARSASTFRASDPRTGEPTGPVFARSSRDDLLAAADAGFAAARALTHELNTNGPARLAAFLDDYADRLDADARTIAELADRETALGVSPRFTDAELPRTTDQLRQAAACARDASWRDPRIDHSHNIRSILEPLGGPVLVMGPNNFPLAYNAVAGGDFAAALAAGNPVIAKGHPAHPATTERLAHHAFDAVRASGLPDATIQLIYDCDPDDGLALVRDPRVRAVGFTGSRPAGLALKRAADETGTPIYLELSSINPVVVLAGALRERGAEIARELADSMLAAGGQQCTSPGFVVLPRGDDADAFVRALAGHLQSAELHPRLTAGVRDGFVATFAAFADHGAELVLPAERVDRPGFYVSHALARTDASRALAHPDVFQREAFGAGALCVTFDGVDQGGDLLASLEGQLTGSIYSARDGSDDGEYACLAPILRDRCGRLLNDAVPTGVRVVASMVHGGPFPATGHPGFTAVGMPTAIARFAARRCYDRVRAERLPPELRG